MRRNFIVYICLPSAILKQGSNQYKECCCTLQNIQDELSNAISYLCHYPNQTCCDRTYSAKQNVCNKDWYMIFQTLNSNINKKNQLFNIYTLSITPFTSYSTFTYSLYHPLSAIQHLHTLYTTLYQLFNIYILSITLYQLFNIYILSVPPFTSYLTLTYTLYTTLYQLFNIYIHSLYPLYQLFNIYIHSLYHPLPLQIILPYHSSPLTITNNPSLSQLTPYHYK